MRRWLTLVLCLVAGACHANLADVDRLVQSGVDGHAYPGAVVVIGCNGRIVHQAAYGRMTYSADSAPVKLDTLWDLASVSKVVGTTTAALLMLEDGRFSVWDRVASYIPAYAAGEKNDIVIRDLLTHTSGMPAYDSAPAVEKTRAEGESNADALINHYATLKRPFPRATRVNYSCLNMQTLARVVENASGERMEDILRRRVWNPIGMRDTAYSLSPDQMRRAAPTVPLPDGSLLQGRVHDPLARYYGCETHTPGNAGLFSTGPDLARFCQMILNGGELDGVRVLDEALVRRATRLQLAPSINDWRGFGWDIYRSGAFGPREADAEKGVFIGHTGFTGTFVWMDKGTGAYVVFLTNSVFPSPAKPTASLFAIRRSVLRAALDAGAGAGSMGG
ncbi:MAG: beta-lactamase family protein [Armatimonadetes bacterium]|nr:beta-lactamase family protein [Armatimonadota bacterium]